MSSEWGASGPEQCLDYIPVLTMDSSARETSVDTGEEEGGGRPVVDHDHSYKCKI